VQRTDGSWLGNFAGVRVYRDGKFVTELSRAAADTGTVDQYIDTAPAGFHTYAVSTVDADVPPHESVPVPVPPVFLGPYPILVWEAPGVPAGRADSLVSTLDSFGLNVEKVSDLFTYSTDLRGHPMIFGVLGWSVGCYACPSYSHHVSTAESDALETFAQTGNGLYIEGGDCFYWDIRNSWGMWIEAFGLLGPSYPQPHAPMPFESGVADLAGFYFANRNADAVDGLLPQDTRATPVMTCGTANITTFCTYQGRRSIATTIGFADLIDSSTPSYMKRDLVRKYLIFMGLDPDTLTTVAVPGTPSPGFLELSAGIPNPFQQRTELHYALPEEGPVRLQVFDVSGRRIRTLFAGVQSAGRHSAQWDGRTSAGAGVGPGIYFVSLQAGGEERRSRVVRLAPY
jgi:hypothetical protein